MRIILPCHRFVPAATLKIAYGYEVLEKVVYLFIEVVEGLIHLMVQNDPLMSLAEEIQVVISQATQPGRFLVDAFPWLQFVPEWLPGTGWKKTAREWRQICERMPDTGYKWTLEQIVRFLKGACLALTFSISPETRQGHSFLHFGTSTTVGP